MARIAIVGAGPAGSSAGWHLASRHHEVTLVDRAAFPRPKTCGDWITLGSVAELARLGLSRADIERQAVDHAAIAGTVIIAPNGRRTSSEGRESAYCIPRLIFDAMLWRHAVAAGCRPVRRSVRDISADPELAGQFDHVIDARGALAGTANAVALRAYWTVPRDRLRAGDAAVVQIHTDAWFRRGYGWLFPVGGDAGTLRVNVGVGLWRADSAEGGTIADFYERFTSTNTVIARWRTGAVIERPVGCHVGLGLWRNVVAPGGVLRIGDAANLADPLTGDGIGNALASGRLVADVIDRHRDRDGAARAWQARHDEFFIPEFRRALVIRRALTGSTGKNAAASALAMAPWLRRRVHAALFGEIGYREIVRRWQ
ncbi:MAG: NAD(P)/FAD-dependent oxidoreductase [Acidobacteria bacterium]|nr:NAD(P)/FAD-dependent oxidoreductase [Acidobacteriota bacterium]